MRRTALAGLLAFVLVVAPVSAAITLPAQPLESQTDQFETEERVTADYQRLQLSVTVAESAGAVGLTGVEHTDFDTTYIAIDYDESVSRTLKIPVPDSYAAPRPKDGLEAAESDLTADLERGPDGETTILTVDVDGQTDVVFPLSKAAGVVFSVRDGVRETVSNRTGLPIPSLSSAGSWTVVNDSLVAQSTYEIRHDSTDRLAVQYDANGEGRWVPVAPCDTEDTPVCELERASNDTVTTVLADSEDPPRIRYQTNPGILTDIQGSLNDILQIPDRLGEALQEVREGIPFL